VLNVLGGFCVSVHLTPSGYEVFWPDTPTEKQKLIRLQLQIPAPGTRMPDVRPASQEADLTRNSASFFEFMGSQRIHSIETLELIQEGTAKRGRCATVLVAVAKLV